jgi:hypothetical protein
MNPIDEIIVPDPILIPFLFRLVSQAEPQHRELFTFSPKIVPFSTIVLSSHF